MNWNEWQTDFARALAGASFEARDGAPDARAGLVRVLRTVRLMKHKLFFIGNGGSAAIASHFANDFQNAARIPSSCFNDAASVTCIANDLGYENAFLEPLKYHAKPADVLFAISSSGNSASILGAARWARDKDLCVFTLSGFSPDNPLRKLGDFNVYVPSSRYGPVEAAHFCVLHGLLDEICDKE